MFKETSRAIYLQIADRICDDILSGRYAEDERLPSVREYAAAIEVNANTVMRTYDYLASRDIIFNRRGIGFFISPGATAAVHEIKRRDLTQNQLPELFHHLAMLNFTPDDLAARYAAYLEQNNSK